MMRFTLGRRLKAGRVMRDKRCKKRDKGQVR
jgi:hypothetical protein